MGAGHPLQKGTSETRKESFARSFCKASLQRPKTDTVTRDPSGVEENEAALGF